MLIKIDNRENKLFEIIQDKYLNINYIKFELLEIGDFQFWSNDKKLKIIIERKTINDLKKSIIDGRYQIQKQNMLNMLNKNQNLQCIFLFEGNKNKEKIFDNVQINLLIRDKFGIILTKNLEHTLEILFKIYNLLSKLEKNQEKNSNNKLLEAYMRQNNIFGGKGKILKKNKQNKNINKNIFCYQLMQFPGISSIRAQVLAKHYNNFYNLCKDLKKNNIDNLKELNINGRKLGKKIASNIKINIFNEDKITKK